MKELMVAQFPPIKLSLSLNRTKSAELFEYFLVFLSFTFFVLFCFSVLILQMVVVVMMIVPDGAGCFDDSDMWW